MVGVGGVSTGTELAVVGGEATNEDEDLWIRALIFLLRSRIHEEGDML